MIYLFAMSIKDIYPVGLWSLASPPYVLILRCSVQGTPPFQNYCQVILNFVLLIGYFKMNGCLPFHTYKEKPPQLFLPHLFFAICISSSLFDHQNGPVFFRSMLRNFAVYR